MIIRKAESRDVSGLYALEKELFTTENFPLSRASIAYHVSNNLLYLAEIEGKIAGYVLVLIKRSNAKLYSIGVSKEFRGMGVANRLLERVLSELVALGFERTLLEVRTDNKVAIELYKKIGFTAIKRLKSFYRDGCDAYLMELEYVNKSLQRTI